jgi:poly(A) polymerase
MMLKRLRNLFGRRTTAPAGREGDLPADDERSSGDPPPRIHHGPKVVHRPIPLSEIDPDAVKIVRRLTRFDHTAYLVGGCVRDLLLDRRPKDFDIGTSATPRQVRRLFSNCRIIGKRFRLAHIYFQNGKIIEVATFRAQNGDSEETPESKNGGLLVRDDNVFGTPEEDALRRDFTINALFFDVNDQTVLDHADGLGDLRRRVIHTIGDPEIRFREDPIRILRAIKFAARLDFTIEPSTMAALKKTRNLIRRAAAPRVLEEINRVCRGGAARRSFELMRETGVFEVILPEFAEAYQEHPAAWDLAGPLFDAIDRRFEENEQATGGEILATLLLPLLARRMGWQKDGSAQRPKGLRVRDLVDEFLRPMAGHLRLPRRDQEDCRQIVGTLYRMIPIGGIRRGTRQSMLQRPVMPSCLWIAGILAEQFGGEFVKAREHWSSAFRDSRRSAGSRPGRKSGDRPRAAEAGARQPARRRRKRAPRSRSESTRTGATKTAQGRRQGAAKESAPVRGKQPPPWDDGYFFAALPSVPEMDGDDRARDRSQGSEDSDARSDSPRETARKPRKRRRKRRKPRTPKSGGKDAAPSGSAPSGD